MIRLVLQNSSFWMSARWTQGLQLFGLFALFLLTSCLSGPTSELDQRNKSLRQSTQVVFKYPKGGKFTTQNFYNFPYPHALRLDQDGTPAVGSMPAPKRKQKCSLPPSNNSLVQSLLTTINPDKYIKDLVALANKEARGFALNPSIYFQFSRALLQSSLPPAAASITPKSPVFLINIDDKSPKRGIAIPVEIRAEFKSRFFPTPLVAIRPADGFSLRPKTRYAVVILTQVRDKDGWPLASNPNLTALAAEKPFTDKDKEALRQSFAPLFAFLKKERKLEAKDIAAATVFTTGNPLQELRDLRKFIKEELDAPQPPKDVKCTSNSSRTPYITCTGTYAAPQFQTGRAPFLGNGQGVITYDDKGKPVYTMADLRFALTIPKIHVQPGAVLGQGLPVVMYAHGTGGSYRTFINNGTARRLAQRGIAGFGIDQAVHGTRVDSIGTTSLDFLFFNALNLSAARDNVRQSALDYFWQTRFLQQWKPTYRGQELSFDPKRLWFMGHSQGGLVGPPVIALENDISAAFLSAPGGFSINTLLYKVEPRDPIQIKAVIEYLLCDEAGSFATSHPILALFQNFFESADPLNYSPLILDGSRKPIHLLMTEGTKDKYAPPEVFEPLAIAMRLPLLGTVHKPIPGLAIQNVRRYQLPVRGNYTHPDGTRTTVGFTQHAVCKTSTGRDCDGHFVAFHNPNALRNWQTFFSSLLSDPLGQIH